MDAMLTERATRMCPVVSAAPGGAAAAVRDLGYVGLPVALICAEAGLGVVGVDVDTRTRVVRETGVDSPMASPLAGLLHAGHLAVADDPASLRRADALFVCVPTPVDEREARHEAVRACTAAASAVAASELTLFDATGSPPGAMGV